MSTVQHEASQLRVIDYSSYAHLYSLVFPTPPPTQEERAAVENNLQHLHQEYRESTDSLVTHYYIQTFIFPTCVF